MMTWTKRPGRQSAIEHIGPMDEDISLTADVLMGTASADETAEFERRFVDDDSFFDKVLPVVGVWAMPGDLRALAAGAAGSAGPASQQAAAASKLVTPAAPRAFTTTNKVAGILNIAAAIITMVFVPLYWRYAVPHVDGKAIRELQEQLARTQPPAGATQAGIIPGGSGAPPKPAPTPTPTPTPAPSTAPVIPKALAEPDPNDTTKRPAGTKVSETAIMGVAMKVIGTLFRASDTASLMVELDGGTRVLLKPGSEMRYKALATSKYYAPSISLTGEAAVEVAEFPTSIMMVHSTAGQTSLQAGGSYALRCDSGCRGLQVSVRDGGATLQNYLDPATRVSIVTDEFGEAYRVAPARTVPKSEASKFPVPNPSIRKPKGTP